MPRKPGNHLAIERARSRLRDGLDTLEKELLNRSIYRHILTAQDYCQLLLADMIRIQGHETLETRAYEERLDILAKTVRDTIAREPVKARPRLSLIPGGLS